MKNFLKQNWRELVLILIIIFSFYWFQVRPSNIKKNCWRYVTKDYFLPFSEGVSFLDGEYTDCLRENGLEK